MPVTREHLALIERRLDILLDESQLMSNLRPLPPVLRTYSIDAIKTAIDTTTRDAIPIDRFEVTEIEKHWWTIKFSIPGGDFSLRLAYHGRKNEFRVDYYTCAKLEDAAMYTCAKLEDAAMHMMEYVEKQRIVQALRTTAPNTISIKDVQVRQTERHKWRIHMGTIRHYGLFYLAYVGGGMPFRVDYGYNRYTTHDSLEDTTTHLWTRVSIPKDDTETKLRDGMAKLGQTDQIKVNILGDTKWTIIIITPGNTGVYFTLNYDTDNMQFVVGNCKGTFEDVKEYMWSEAEKISR
jgi:hypothetical protein